MKIGLIYPTKTSAIYKTDEHLGIGYIAAYLKKNEFDENIIQYNIEEISIKYMVKKIINEGYDAIGLSTYYHNYSAISHLFVTLKSLKPNIFIFLGGYLPTLSYEIMKDALSIVDCFVIGEGEITCFELMGKLSQNKDWHDVKGIVYKKNDEIYVTERREMIEDLDLLPFPVRTVIDKKMPMIASRGCYGQCCFCGIQGFYQKSYGKRARVRRRSPKNVVDEILYLKNNYGTEIIDFYDDNFEIGSTNGKKWFDEFYNLIKSNNTHVGFCCNLRANEIINGNNFLERFKEIGLISAFIGIESFIQKQLLFFNKKVSVAQNIEAIYLLENLKIDYSIGILLFDPTITLKEILENLKYLETIANNTYLQTMTPFSPKCTAIPHYGTTLYDYVKDNDLLNDSSNLYRFENKDTQFCHNLLERWTKEVAFFSERSGELDEYVEKNDENRAQYIKNIYKKLFNLDISFIKGLCEKIIGGEHNIDNLDIYIKQQLTKLELLKRDFEDIENLS